MQKLIPVAIMLMACTPTAGLPSPQTPTPGDPNPPPGTRGNPDNIPFIGRGDPKGNPVRLARATGHVSNYTEEKVTAYTLPTPW